MNLVIFGTGSLAELCHFYFTNRSAYGVAGFAVDDAFVDADRHLGLPLVPASRMAEVFPPDDHDAFVAIGYADGNHGRERKCAELAALGYRLASYTDPSAVTADNEVGTNSMIYEKAVLRQQARLGQGVIVATGSIVGHHNTVGNFVYLGPGVVMSGYCRVGDRCFLGAGALLRDGVSIAADTTVGIGSVIVRDIVEPGTYFGNPARLVRRAKSI